MREGVGNEVQCKKLHDGRRLGKYLTKTIFSRRSKMVPIFKNFLKKLQPKPARKSLICRNIGFKLPTKKFPSKSDLGNIGVP
jgi:hypothetical protein